MGDDEELDMYDEFGNYIGPGAPSHRQGIAWVCSCGLFPWPCALALASPVPPFRPICLKSGLFSYPPRCPALVM